DPLEEDEPRSGASPLAGRAHVFWYGAPGAASVRTVRLRRVQLPLALAGAPLAWLFTGIPLTALLVPLGVFGLPWLFDTTRPATPGTAALGAWSEGPRPTAAGRLPAAGPTRPSAPPRRRAPAALEGEIGELAARLQARWRPEEALRAFADSLADATADKVLA